MTTQLCSQCHQPAVTFNYETLSLICEECGFVEGESIVREEVEFKKKELGVEGTNLSILDGEGGGLTTMSGSELLRNRGIGLSVMNEQRQVLARKKSMNRIEQVCASLKIPTRYAQEVFPYVYKVAEGKFTKEKWLDGVIACCVYIVARKNELPVTFLDLAETIGVSIYKLGRAYKEVSSELNIKVEAVDPVMLLERMAQQLIKQLQGEQKMKEVCNAAARLVRVAHLEWLDTGRKPAAVAGAALKIAAESYNINLSFSELAMVSGCGQVSLRERMKEFKAMLINLASPLPWAKTITDKTLPTYLPFLLTFVESLRALHRECLPPFEQKIENGQQSQSLEKQEDKKPSPEIQEDSKKPKSVTVTQQKAESQTTETKLTQTLSPNHETKSKIKKKRKKEDKKEVKKKKKSSVLIGVTTSLPPAFLKSQQELERRREKIRRAKERIKQVISQQSPSTHTTQQLDNEDLEIEKLLMEGVSEQDLERGYYHKPVNIQGGHGEELSEKDLPDAELSTFIKSDAEIELLKSLGLTGSTNNEEDEIEQPKKKKKIS